MEQELSAAAPSWQYSARPSHAGNRIQRVIGWATLIPFCGLLCFIIRFVARYRIDRLPEIRRQYRELLRLHPDEPLVICANHLTFIDSALIIWALGSNFWYARNYRHFSWNLPAGDIFKKKFTFRLVAYLSKCIFIHRDGTKEHRDAVLELCQDLLARGEVVTIFPEGKRSRSGRFEPEKLTYGVGKIISRMDRCNVLCVYLRAENQRTYANYPKTGSRFHFEMKLISPSSRRGGREAYAEIVGQIGSTIRGMEDTYFA